jgi:hypothetical protein
MLAVEATLDVEDDARTYVVRMSPGLHLTQTQEGA